MIYGDTSFVSALYRQGDIFHRPAVLLTGQLSQPIAFTLLIELELHNSVHRALAGQLIDQAEHDAIFRQIDLDEANGIVVRRHVEETDLYARARTLSKKFTVETRARSLDILHVASAQLLKIDRFVSFDNRQRALASKANISVLPRALPGRRG